MTVRIDPRNDDAFDDNDFNYFGELSAYNF